MGDGPRRAHLGLDLVRRVRRAERAEGDGEVADALGPGGDAAPDLCPHFGGRRARRLLRHPAQVLVGPFGIPILVL